MKSKMDLEKLFNSLPPDEKSSVITHGMAFYISSLKKRLFLAEAKLKQFENKYHTTIEKVDSEGLPDNANYEMHEDYVMWHHWNDTSQKLKNRIKSLLRAGDIELALSEELNASD